MNTNTFELHAVLQATGEPLHLTVSQGFMMPGVPLDPTDAYHEAIDLALSHLPPGWNRALVASRLRTVGFVVGQEGVPLDADLLRLAFQMQFAALHLRAKIGPNTIATLFMEGRATRPHVQRLIEMLTLALDTYPDDDPPPTAARVALED